MKNLIYILNMLMILIFASCKDENSFMPGDDEICYTLSVKIPNDADTRATYDDRGSSIAVKWEKGDVVVLKIGSAEYSFLYRSSNSTGEIGEFYHYGKIPGDVNLPDDAVLSFGNVVDGQNKTFSQVQKKNNVCREYLTASMSGVNLTTNPIVNLYPADGYSLLHIQVKSPGMFIGGSKLVIKGLDKTNDYEITLGDPSSVFADNGDLLDIYVTVATGSISSGKTLKFYFYAYDENAPTDPTHGDEYHYYMKCNAPIAMENDKVVKMPLPNRPTHTAIQMGLPSGTKWATMNVGATKETETGNYYAWGEVETKSSYTDGNSVTIDKTYSYLKGSVLNKFQLAVEYDAATENWGNDWVMPTNAEAKELVNGCTWTPATKDGVSGYSVSRGDKSIFLPATGYMGNTGIANASYAYYWLSSLVNDNYTYLNKVASSLYFDGSGKGVSSGGLRSHGRTIRPILASSRASQEYKWEFDDIEGTLPGEFSVSASKKVKFSKGNLQYQASTNTWRFAENQYDVRGLENDNISSTYDGWIDLFGWGTSGWNSGAKAYQPWSTSSTSSDYNVGNSATKSLTGDCANADWGVYNRISNGGDEAGLWRILTGDESNYLINSRPNAANLRTKATVNGVPGVLLFPDGWKTPSDISVTMNVKVRFKTNVYTAEQFEYLEFLGVVFLPAGGYRNEVTTNQLGEGGSGNSYDGENITGSYWTSSRKDGSNAFCYVFKNKNDDGNKPFYENVIVAKGNCGLYGGCNVRLIHNVK